MFVFPLQKCLRENVLILRYRSIARYVNIVMEYLVESIFALRGIRG